jgi:uncharacterized protein (DUF2249 family)
MSTQASASRILDIRVLDGCVNRKAHVLEALDALAPGESVVVVNDHLPRGLRVHFEEQRPQAFDWTLLQDGPQVWQVRITRL